MPTDGLNTVDKPRLIDYIVKVDYCNQKDDEKNHCEENPREVIEWSKNDIHRWLNIRSHKNTYLTPRPVYRGKHEIYSIAFPPCLQRVSFRLGLSIRVRLRYTARASARSELAPARARSPACFGNHKPRQRALLQEWQPKWPVERLLLLHGKRRRIVKS